jgi:hypothetical protein
MVRENATRERQDSVVCQHVAIQRIERRVVDVRSEDAFFEIVTDNHAHRPTERPKRALVQRGRRIPIAADRASFPKR